MDWCSKGVLWEIRFIGLQKRKNLQRTLDQSFRPDLKQVPYSFILKNLPIIKSFRSSWTSQEDRILIKGFQIHHSKWSQIAEKLTGRNPYSIKNRFYSLCTRFGIQKNSTNLNEDLNKILHTLPVTKRIHTNEKINNFVHHNSESIAQNYNFQMNVPVGYYECVNPVYVMNFSTGNFTNFLIENFKYFLK